MYTIDSVQRLVRKIGLTEALKIIANVPDNVKKQLEKDFIFVGGYPNVQLISSLL